jgi:signal transduction histidine kinase
VSLVATAGRVVRQQLRNLRHALVWGPEEPVPILRRFRRASLRQLTGIGLLLALIGSLVYMSVLAHMPLEMGGWWWPLIMVLTVVLLLVVVRRPLLAWRIGALALLYELTMLGSVERRIGAEAGSYGASRVPPAYVPDWFPPLFISEIQVLVFFLVLLAAAASQARGVVFWVWAASAALVWVAPSHWSLDLEAVVRQMVALPQPLAGGGFMVGGPVVDPQPYRVGGVVLVTVVVLAGQLVRHQSRTRQQLAEVQERGLLLDERARIARELHDVVAHHVSMIAVRSETAPYRLGELPEQVRAEFAEISQASRESLSEMRRLLGVLRSDAPAPTAPQPGLADLAELVEWTRGAGTPVTLEMRGSMSGLPAAVDVSAYRILQEALTNAARHATGAPVHLRLERTDTHLWLSVRNGPRETAAGGDHGAPPAAGEGGHGVRGMRERIAMLGGQLQVGPTDDGGFEVTATLPLSGGAQ